MKNNDSIYEINNRMKTLKKQSDYLDCQLCALRKKGEEYCDAYNCMWQIKTKTANEYNRLCKQRLEVYKAISEIEDMKTRTLLEYRYIYLMSYENIADLVNYSVRQTIRRIQEGVKQIKKITATDKYKNIS